MSEANKSPFYMEEVTEGERYSCCSCGDSSDMPFCDGINCAEDSVSIPYKADASKTVKFCGCGRSGTAPICDGSHNNQA